MKNVKNALLLTALFLFASLSCVFILKPSTTYAAPCEPKSSVLGLPTWYKFLDGQQITDETTGTEICQPDINGIYDIWKIVAAAIDILLRVATMIAIGFVVYGGITYILSQGAPDKTKEALKTIINALVGLAISIVASVLVGFIAGRFN